LATEKKIAMSTMMLMNICATFLVIDNIKHKNIGIDMVDFAMVHHIIAITARLENPFG
jgi:hypothetical protein